VPTSAEHQSASNGEKVPTSAAPFRGAHVGTSAPAVLETWQNCARKPSRVRPMLDYQVRGEGWEYFRRIACMRLYV
jgi:hypothetical protein